MSALTLRAVLVESRERSAVYDVLDNLGAVVSSRIDIAKPGFSPAWLYIRVLATAPCEWSFVRSDVDEFPQKFEIGYMAAPGPARRTDPPDWSCEVSPCCSVPWQEHTENNPWLECAGCGSPKSRPDDDRAARSIGPSADLWGRYMQAELAAMFDVPQELRDAWGIRPVTKEERAASAAALRAALWTPRFERVTLPGACYRSEYGFMVHVTPGCRCAR